MSQRVQLVPQIGHNLPSEYHSLVSVGSVVILTQLCVIVERIQNEIGISYRQVHIILEEDLWMLHVCVWNMCCSSDRGSVLCCSFCEEPDSNHPPFTAFSGCFSVWLLALPRSHSSSPKFVILHLRGNVIQHNNSSCSHAEVLLALTGALEQVCIWRSVVMLGWLRFYICSSCCITCLEAFGSFSVHITLYHLHIGLSLVEKEAHKLKNKCVQNYG